MKVIFDNDVYPSFKDFCEKKGLNYDKACRERRLGVSLEDIVNGRSDIRLHYVKTTRAKSSKTIVYGKREYRSLNELCERLGISYSTVYGRMNRGTSVVAAVERSYLRGLRIRAFEFNSIPYERLSDVALDYNLNYLALCKRVKLTGQVVESVRYLIETR